MRRFCLLTIVIFLMIGCASVEITQITKQKPYKEGLRFYRPHPYLLISQDKDDPTVFQSTIIWLPNKNEEYVIRVKGSVGSVNMTSTLENGWNLTGFGETRDSKTPEIITAVSGFIPAGAKVVGKELKPGLYKFKFKEGLITTIEAVFTFEK